MGKQGFAEDLLSGLRCKACLDVIRTEKGERFDGGLSRERGQQPQGVEGWENMVSGVPRHRGGE